MRLVFTIRRFSVCGSSDWFHLYRAVRWRTGCEPESDLSKLVDVSVCGLRRATSKLLRDDTGRRRAAVVADGAILAERPQLLAAPAAFLLLADLLRHKSGRHVWQDRIGRVGSGCDGGALLLLRLMLQPGLLPPLLGVATLVTGAKRPFGSI